nr:CocE/NonD family hydrolase [Sphingomonas sp. Y57]
MPSVTVEWGVGIAMRDGTILRANIYRPSAIDGPIPAILVMTPYTRDHVHGSADHFARTGLACVVVDVRGRGDSEGDFRPNLQEAPDARDIIEWLGRQPFCNGKVGMYGPSYLGYVQWAAIKERSSHLATIVPTAAPYMGVDFPMRGGIFYPYLIKWLSYTQGATAQRHAGLDTRFWAEAFAAWHRSGEAFRKVGDYAGISSPVFQQWLDHPDHSPYWDAYSPTEDDFAGLDLPVLTVTGIYDDDQPGALEYHRRHLAANPAARARHFLVIGPWDHAGTGYPQLAFGGLQLSEAARFDSLGFHRAWYAWVLEDGERPAFLKDQVAYYVMGADAWRYAPSLGAVTTRSDPLFLSSDGRADDIFASGRLDPVACAGPPDHYRHDPRDVTGAEIDAETRASGGSLTDQSVALAMTGKQLVYHSAPFEADTEICGFFRLSAWIAIDGPDTDFYVSVHEIDREGNSIRLSNAALRARYRTGFRTPELVTDDAPRLYEFDGFTFTARRVAKGSRLRLIIAPMGRLVEATFAQRNFQSGGAVADETVADARAITVRLFHSAEHPSVLFVPLGEEAGA